MVENLFPFLCRISFLHCPSLALPGFRSLLRRCCYWKPASVMDTFDLQLAVQGSLYLCWPNFHQTLSTRFNTEFFEFACHFDMAGARERNFAVADSCDRRRAAGKNARPSHLMVMAVQVILFVTSEFGTCAWSREHVRDRTERLCSHMCSKDKRATLQRIVYFP